MQEDPADRENIPAQDNKDLGKTGEPPVLAPAEDRKEQPELKDDGIGAGDLPASPLPATGAGAYAQGKISPKSETISDEQLKKYRRGDLDTTGCEINDVYVATKKFILYDCGGRTRHFLPDDYETAKALRKKIAGLGGLRASIDDLRADPVISGAKRGRRFWRCLRWRPDETSRQAPEENESRRAGRETAWALESALESEVVPGQDASLAAAQAKEILEGVDARLRSFIKSAHRRKYAVSNLIAFGIIVALLSIIAFVSWKRSAVIESYAIYGVFGALGAFLSVITTIRRIDFDVNVQGWEHIFSGATRILIGVIGAFVIALALDCQLIDPTFGSRPDRTQGAAAASTQQSGTGENTKKGADGTSATGSDGGGKAAKPAEVRLNANGNVDNIFAMYLIFAFIAGFSESLVPNILRRGEQAAGVADDKPNDGPIVQTMKPKP